MPPDRPQETAADLAATAAFLLMADELGLSALLDAGTPFSRAELADAANNRAEGIAAFLDVLVTVGLVVPAGDGERFVAGPGYADRRYEAGYLTWALNANRPYLEAVAEFIADYDSAAQRHRREGRRVAVSSRWMGSYGATPVAVAEITGRDPRRVADLGAGAGGLLIELLRALPGATGSALDLNAAACEEAVRAAKHAGVADRLDVTNRSIQSLIEDPGPIEGADVIHAGFVMHDVMPEPAAMDAVLRTCRGSLREGGALVIMDAVPYAPDPRERAFSALFTYLHTMAMHVELPTQEQWQAAFEHAGFTSVTCTPLRFPGGRMFVVSG